MKLAVGDTVRCSCTRGDQIVVEIKGSRVRTDAMGRSTFTSNDWGHFTLVQRPESERVQALGGTKALGEAWVSDGLQVVADALLEKGWIENVTDVDEPKDVALLRLERSVRRWIADELEPGRRLYLSGYPNTSFKLHMKTGETAPFCGLATKAPRQLVAEPLPAAIVPMTAWVARAVGFELPRLPQGSARRYYIVSSAPFDNAPWLSVLSGTWPDGRHLVQHTAMRPYVDTVIDATDAKHARARVAEVLGLHAVVQGGSAHAVQLAAKRVERARRLLAQATEGTR